MYRCIVDCSDDVQKPDWLKDFTDAEVEAVRRGHWDAEDVDLDPIHCRYVQPTLKVRADEHERVLADAVEASRLTDDYNNGAQVCCAQYT